MNNFLFRSSDKLYTYEGLLSSWIQTSITLLTTAMLFYHITRVNTLKADRSLAALITIVLLIISTVYLVLSLINYIPRVQEAIKLCDKEENCNYNNSNYLRKTMITYSAMVSVTIIIQIIIGYMVYDTI